MKGNAPLMKNYKLDKTVISFASLHDEPDERAYWHSKTPNERLDALAFMRRIAYGDDASTRRLERVVEVIQRKSR